MENTNGRNHLPDSDLTILSGDDVAEVLAGQELAVIDIVSRAYQAHSKGESSLPHSTFLLFPFNPANRIIALPAYLGGDVNSAGVKWIASFPGNVKTGDDRVSAMLILNSVENGRPKAVLESSMISAWRTAASAALAARTLGRKKISVAGLIGCGVINFEILRFLQATCPDLERALVYDLSTSSAEAFKKRCGEEFPAMRVEVAGNVAAVFRNADVLSFATTAGKPHVQSLSMCAPGTVVLHISLRDLAPEVILASDNIVDDLDHVCRAQTSIHLAEQQIGNRRFIRCTLADILNGSAQPQADPGKLAVFSPFGLGILDIALGEFVFGRATEKGQGAQVRSFFPQPWRHAKETAAS
jgi:2,3-diaminopropionate biosynthesis protein SbnB